MKVNKKSAFILGFFGLSLVGCSTTSDNRDPYENYNRAMYDFNDKAYSVLRPLAKGYDAVVPDAFQTGIFNFFNNLREPARIVNDLFQGEFSYAGDDSIRFLTNTTIGLAGFIDVADDWYGKEMRYHQSFAVTLHKWGWYDNEGGSNNKSPYIVWPLLGPGVLEDAATGVDALFNPLTYSFLIPGVGVAAYAISYGTTAAYYTNQGVSYLPAYDNLQEVSVDPYIAMRNAYIQNYDYGMSKVLKQELEKDDSTIETDAAVLGVLGLDGGSLDTLSASSGSPSAVKQEPTYMLKSKLDSVNKATKVDEAFSEAYANDSSVVSIDDLEGKKPALENQDQTPKELENAERIINDPTN
ncbi:MlaA family lipoprotein [Francisella frigiditurris]|uniref:VacJ like lipofamily protein n=1 Tax=Francisella frigiditurris TaxID=1542390 RepID=A0A1J0KSF8_9GAMM|nr:VacJ family lipoprotein [Francisella frigiditurris]APC96619.1 vacJ like lipofamily protein [Francisella frigiditurris]